MRDILAATAILTLVVATPALAQTGVGDSAPASGAPAVQPVDAGDASDVIITARKREESIRDVPGTISAVTSDLLNQKGPVAGVGDLLNTVPGVRFNDVASENLAEVSIRGSGTARATGADSGVGLFVNGAYAGSSTLGGRNFKAIDYFDIERVEVLEGPQGALYGRNSEFGVVNVVLTKPKFQDSGYIRDTFTAGLDQNRLAAVANKMISDDTAVRLGFETFNQTKGFYYDPNHRKYYDSTNGFTGRAQLRYRSGGLDVTALIDGQDLNLPTFVNSLVVPGGGVNAQIPQGYQQSRFTLPHEGRDSLRQKVLRGMIMASYDLGGVTLESTTMVTKWRSTQQYAAAIDLATELQLRAKGQIGIYPFNQVKTDVEDKTFYQDLHLSGKAMDDRLSWIVGGEALFQRDNYQLAVASSPCAFTLTASICGGTPTNPVCVKPLPTSPNCPAKFPLVFGTDSRTRQQISSFAGYASLQYAIGNLTLAGEGRFSHDSKTVTQAIYALYTENYTKVPTTFEFKSNEPAYTFTASYKLPNLGGTLLYAKVGSGYRAGGVNNGTYNAAAPNPFVSTYGNEKTLGYEAGVKSNLAHNIFLRLSGYLSRTNEAITSISDGCTVTNACGVGGQVFNVNGGTIHARGVEAAIDGRFDVAGGRLNVSLNAANQHATFAKVPVGGVSGLPIEGTSIAQIPDWTMSANVNYAFPITTTVKAFVNANYAGQRGGGQDTVTIATPYIPMSDFDIFGAQAGITFNTVTVSMFVRNITDQEIQVLKFMQAGYPLSVRYNKPRTFGGSVAYRW
ncbi:MAG: TonB-dependent receptor [Candidatus Sphingomonas colombiensis]|nr:TonB-dependent receptor [Sphingomonas sp.]WEK43894.1 MAG: TonB-dependent receptor [Sphingomonas sp.]